MHNEEGADRKCMFNTSHRHEFLKWYSLTCLVKAEKNEIVGICGFCAVFSCWTSLGSSPFVQLENPQ